MRRARRFARLCLCLFLFLAPSVLAPGLGSPAPAQAQAPSPVPEPRGSENVEVVSHLPLGGPFTVSDIEIEQETARPFAYVSRMYETGFDVIDLSEPGHPRVIHEWRIENAELHRGTGAMDVKYFRDDGRYYVVQSLQFSQGGPNADLGAAVFDVTGLPERAPREVARIRHPDSPGGFHNIFTYKHSDGRPLLFATTTGDHANVYDLRRVLAGEDSTLAGTIGVPENPIGDALGFDGYHDFYVGYDPIAGADKFYGGGAGGYYVFDVTDLSSPELLASITGVPGLNWGHTVTPDPTGRYIVGETEYQYAPLRIFDMKPALDGERPTISQPVSAWTADWRNLVHNHEMRWPYVFVSGYEDGLQIFNLMDPTEPFTEGYYDTYPGPHKVGMCGDRTCNGAFGVDVRNADGLIVVSDMATGFWAFRLEGFAGWHGHRWGMPNVSSAQDWENGPEGADGDYAGPTGAAWFRNQ